MTTLPLAIADPPCDHLTMTARFDDLPHAPSDLRSQLERSNEDLAAGRLTPLQGVLTAIHGRAARRFEEKRRKAARRAADVV